MRNANRIRKRIALIVVFSFILAALPGCGKDAGEQEASDTSRATEETSTEEQLHSEGVDTKCEVSYKTYTGEYASMFLR
jgi:hypothetical protein